MRYKKYLTVKQWKKFDSYVDIENGDDITMQEISIRKYEIILTDHRTKKYTKVRYPNDTIKIVKIGKMCPTPLKEKLKTSLKEIPSKLTIKNMNKGFKKLDEGFTLFDKAVNLFSKGFAGSINSTDSVLKDLGIDKSKKDKQKDWSVLTGNSVKKWTLN